jgi:hypothetical protein
LLRLDQGEEVRLDGGETLFDGSNTFFNGNNTFFSAALRLDQGEQMGLDGSQTFFNSSNTFFSAALRLHQIADQRWKRQDLLRQHQATEICTPLGAFLEKADEVTKFLNGERHFYLTAEHT